MCLAIPSEIIEIDGEMAVVSVGGALRKASLMLLPEPPGLGDFVIVHAGFALHTVD
ncbi:MAG: HypC/HybG/HupF family hydrogenase formation chaperone, partial [Synergistales bacterium]|nr:HypC/HybG/HupF family hydrogenase formation chaperone [Synergistales bacterium]